MNDNQFAELTKKLDTITKLLALEVSDSRGATGQAVILTMAGLTPREIGDVLGKDPHAISQALYRFKKQQESRKEEAEPEGSAPPVDETDRDRR
ncbi:MAG: hypothetical protein ACE5IJ_01660 [Thermoplasmata archaeon]